MPSDKLKSLMAADSACIKTCDHIRDKFAFHADKEPVMEWLNGRPPLEGVGLMAQSTLDRDPRTGSRRLAPGRHLRL
jgi:hypothetical protein